MIKDPYIKTDICGFPFNSKFPPNESKGLYNGYKTPAEECLFYDFAVLGYDLMIRYKEQPYYFMVDIDCVWLSDEGFTAMIKKFDNGNDVLENFYIEDTPLYKLVDKLDAYEPM